MSTVLSLSLSVPCHWVMCSAVLHYTAVRLWRAWAARRGGERQPKVFVCMWVHTHMTPRFSPKTERVARQQEHAVTGMSGFACFFFFFLKRQVGVWINPAYVDSMLACPSKANQATTPQPCATYTPQRAKAGRRLTHKTTFTCWKSVGTVARRRFFTIFGL